ncbi:hypothetical protein [Streptomyces sp. NPDC096030]|uniref:hypothetical protein n=1 Tax=Streptomyces sp. NPDC096030 TaxID=3155423 RepID=UPI00331FF91B
MAVQDAKDQGGSGELEDLFDAPEDGTGPSADPFATWGEASSPSDGQLPAQPAAATAARRPTPAAASPQPQTPALYPEDDDADDHETRGGQSGFRVSQDVANRLKEYRQAHDLTVTDVVIQALDHVANEIPKVISRAKMPARVTPTRSRFAARGSKGPLKGTGPVQRWWQPTKDDKAVMREMALEAGLRDTPGILIAVALNEFLPGGVMYVAGELRHQMHSDEAFQVPNDLALARIHGVSREVARLALLQLQVEGLIPVDQA